MPKVGLDRTKTGRAKGTPNKINAELKDMIIGALNDVGGQAYLARQANENPGPFLALVGKILPKEVKADVDMKGHVVIQASPLDERI